MTRPGILDLDLVVVPREPVREMWAASGDAIAQVGQVHHDRISELSYTAMLSASPYLTAWGDVRKYVEGLEREAAMLRRLLSKQTETYRSRTTELEKLVADAARVIEPFAKRAGKLDGIWNDHETQWSPADGSTEITIGNLRAASAFADKLGRRE